MFMARKFVVGLLSLVITPVLLAVEEAQSNPSSGESLWMTYQEEDQRLYAICLQPSERLDYPRPSGYEVVVLFDTSASQTGWVRREALEVLEEFSATLPVGTKMALIACDVESVHLTGDLVAPTDPEWAVAVSALRRRIPLGTTDLGGALRTAVDLFSDGDGIQKTIVYIGDGVNRHQLTTEDQHRQLISDMVASRISISSLAIGPFVDVPTLAALANHTGGVLFSRQSIQESAQLIGRNLGISVATPVVWVDAIQLPETVASHFPAQFPPLRIDRDSVIIGHLEVSDQGETRLTAGRIELVGSVAGNAMELQWNLEPQASDPDMGFLTALVDRAARDGGLRLPTLGSAGLRALSLVMADNATAMIKSGQFALRTGQPETAVSIATEALKLDPNNAEAINLLKAAQNELKGDEDSVPTGKLMQFGGNQPGGSGDSLLGETLAAGDLLRKEQEMRGAATQALQQHVRNQLNEARRIVAQDPIGVKNTLKLLMEEVDRSVDLNAADRSLLRDQIGSAIEQASVQEVRFRQRIAQSEAVRSQADAAERILNETQRGEDSLKQLVEHFNFLMSRQRYLEASKDVAPEIQNLVPDSVLAVVAREKSSLVSNQALVMDAFKRREQGIVDALRGVEEAAIPFDGNPPVIYPAPEIWQALSARRKERYAPVSISIDDDRAENIHAALKQRYPDSINYTDVPLTQVASDIEEIFKVPVWINTAELDIEGIDPDTPINLQIPPVSLRSALRLMLLPLNLTYIIRNEVLEITSVASVESDPISRIYPVGDLVVPPMPMGGGMMGGGMMGGMGGMGGGMGGMGGMGMGGMGGGMGGMGGMGGGMGMGGMGMMAVPDDTSKKVPISGATKTMTGSKSEANWDLNQWVSSYEQATDEELTDLNSRVQRMVHEHVQTAQALIEAQQLDSARAEFRRIIDLVGGLLSAGYPQPWMYQALSLSMEACDYPASEMKRVLLSSLDFDANADQALDIARYMARKGMKSEALVILRDIAMAEPLRHDVFAFALPLARETQELTHLKWVCAGILNKAWPTDLLPLFDQALTLAQATHLGLTQDGRVLEASDFEQQMNHALRRDLMVRVNWTGQADLDLRVREPAGTVCSLSNPMTLSGGVLIGDTSSLNQKAQLGGFSEYYICAQGYSGQYDIMIRRVWGEVSGGKATVEIYTDFGTPNQNRIIQEVDLTEKDVLVQVAVKNGQRTEPIAETQLAAVRAKQLATGRAVLSQIGESGTNPSGSSSSGRNEYFAFRQMQMMNGARGFGFPRGPGAVGYMPVITTLPEGAMLMVSGVVSKDRRYVRISPSPFFTGIGEIFTFNFVSGETGGGGGGMGGGMGGMGGGMGGMGGGMGGMGGGGAGPF
jgi:hypothetical protein